MERKGEMTVSEAGHMGGERTAETHGKERYPYFGNLMSNVLSKAN